MDGISLNRASVRSQEKETLVGYSYQSLRLNTPRSLVVVAIVGEIAGYV
jgi:hypothetical protein